MGVSLLEPSGLALVKEESAAAELEEKSRGRGGRSRVRLRQAFRLSGDLRGAILSASSHFQLWQLNNLYHTLRFRVPKTVHQIYTYFVQYLLYHTVNRKILFVG